MPNPESYPVIDWPSVDEPSEAELEPSTFVVYTPNGFLADWDRRAGGPLYNRHIENAALWSTPGEALRIARVYNGCVLCAEDGRLLTLEELGA